MPERNTTRMVANPYSVAPVKIAKYFVQPTSAAIEQKPVATSEASAKPAYGASAVFASRRARRRRARGGRRGGAVRAGRADRRRDREATARGEADGDDREVARRRDQHRTVEAEPWNQHEAGQAGAGDRSPGVEAVEKAHPAAEVAAPACEQVGHHREGRAHADRRHAQQHDRDYELHGERRSHRRKLGDQRVETQQHGKQREAGDADQRLEDQIRVDSCASAREPIGEGAAEGEPAEERGEHGRHRRGRRAHREAEQPYPHHLIGEGGQPREQQERAGQRQQAQGGEQGQSAS